MRILALVVALLVFAPVSTSIAEAGPKKPTGSGSSHPSAELLRAEAKQLVRVVSRLRGLAVRRSVAMGVMTREMILAELEQRLSEEYTEDEIAAESAVLKRLGLLPRDSDYKRAILELLTDQVAGFYNPSAKRLNIAAWLPLMLQRPALAHEICHALQDQHFRLKRFTKPAKDDSDRQLARAALVEGDCTGLMLEYVLAPTGVDLSSISGSMTEMITKVMGSGTPKFQAAPYFLRETLTFPYLYGLQFVQRLREKASWGAVDRVFRRPPETTEQVMHSAKYRQRERPRRIRLRRLKALAGYQVIKRDTLGEFQLRLALRLGVDDRTASLAAAGWDGDRLVALRRKGSMELPLLVHLSSWDSEKDAIEFAQAQEQMVRKMTAKPVEVDGDAAHIYSDNEQAVWLVDRRGRRVLALMAVPAELRVRLQRELWRRFAAN